MLRDLRYGLRGFANHPGFSIVAVLSLALGIGANTTVFSWVDALLLHPLPGVNNAGLVAFEAKTASGEYLVNSYGDYRDYRDHLRLLAGLTIAQPAPLAIGTDERPERMWAEFVAGNYFDVLGVRAKLGRVFLSTEFGDKPGAYPVAVISEQMWRTRFHSDPLIAGKTLRVNRHDLTIVGVTPAEFRGTTPGLAFDLFIPVMMRPQLTGVGEWMLTNRQVRDMHGIARLAPGVTMAQANAELTALATEMARANPKEDGGMTSALMPIAESHFGVQTRLAGLLRILMVVGGVLLLIVCANVASFLLVRTASRQKEFTVRLALGAGRARLLRQMLTESLLLAAAGAVGGGLLTLWSGRLLGVLLPASEYPLDLELRLSPTVFLFTLLASTVTAIVAGVLPALQASRANLNDVLKDGGRSGTSGAGTRRTRGWFVSAEVALALITLIGAGLFAKSFGAARKIDPGFDANNVLVAPFYLANNGYSLEQQQQFLLRLRERMSAAPGVTAVSYADSIPLRVGGSWEEVDVEGYIPRRDENMKIYRNVVAPGFFDLTKVAIAEGRDFTEHDDRDSRDVMIVNQEFVTRFFAASGAGRNAIGRRVHGWGRSFTIVGVAANSKYVSLTETPRPYMYLPFRQVFGVERGADFYVRTAGDPASVLSTLREEVRTLDPNVAVFGASPLAEAVGASLYPQRVAAAMLAILGTLSVGLAAMGLYGVMAYSVAQQSRELGIRMALGARPGDVLRLVAREGLLLTGGGLLAGLLAAYVLSAGVASALVGTSPHDLAVFGGATFFLAIIAALASLIPARRATKVDPLITLKYE